MCERRHWNIRKYALLRDGNMMLQVGTEIVGIETEIVKGSKSPGRERNTLRIPVSVSTTFPDPTSPARTLGFVVFWYPLG